MMKRSFGVLLLVHACLVLAWPLMAYAADPVIGTAEPGRSSFGVQGLEGPPPPPPPKDKDRTQPQSTGNKARSDLNGSTPQKVNLRPPMGLPHDFGVGGVFGESTSPDGKGVYGYVTVGGPNSAGVWGESTGQAGTAVVAKAEGPRSTGIYASGTSHAGFFQGDVTIIGSTFFGSQTGQMLNLWGTEYGIGIQDFTEYFRTADGFCWFRGGSPSKTTADPGNGGKLLMRLDNTGTLSVPVLQITGGADLAEPFPLATPEIPKGSVVIIDNQHAGQLKLSDRPYDQRVAGIVSGANGINPGIALRQDGALPGGRNVALSGRVYVLADATTDPIKPGDLLTTSNTPGHAMKATDHAKAQGAVIGKAMSELKTGTGMVLVLVTLQ